MSQLNTSGNVTGFVSCFTPPPEVQCVSNATAAALTLDDLNVRRLRWQVFYAFVGLGVLWTCFTVLGAVLTSVLCPKGQTGCNIKILGGVGRQFTGVTFLVMAIWSSGALAQGQPARTDPCTGQILSSGPSSNSLIGLVAAALPLHLMMALIFSIFQTCVRCRELRSNQFALFLPRHKVKNVLKELLAAGPVWAPGSQPVPDAVGARGSSHVWYNSGVDGLRMDELEELLGHHTTHLSVEVLVSNLDNFTRGALSASGGAFFVKMDTWCPEKRGKNLVFRSVVLGAMLCSESLFLAVFIPSLLANVFWLSWAYAAWELYRGTQHLSLRLEKKVRVLPNRELKALLAQGENHGLPGARQLNRVKDWRKRALAASQLAAVVPRPSARPEPPPPEAAGGRVSEDLEMVSVLPFAVPATVYGAVRSQPDTNRRWRSGNAGVGAGALLEVGTSCDERVRWRDGTATRTDWDNLILEAEIWLIRSYLDTVEREPGVGSAIEMATEITASSWRSGRMKQEGSVFRELFPRLKAEHYREIRHCLVCSDRDKLDRLRAACLPIGADPKGWAPELPLMDTATQQLLNAHARHVLALGIRLNDHRALARTIVEVARLQASLRSASTSIRTNAANAPAVRRCDSPPPSSSSLGRYFVQCQSRPTSPNGITPTQLQQSTPAVSLRHGLTCPMSSWVLSSSWEELPLPKLLERARQACRDWAARQAEVTGGWSMEQGGPSPEERATRTWGVSLADGVNREQSALGASTAVLNPNLQNARDALVTSPRFLRSLQSFLDHCNRSETADEPIRAIKVLRAKILQDKPSYGTFQNRKKDIRSAMTTANSGYNGGTVAGHALDCLTLGPTGCWRGAMLRQSQGLWLERDSGERWVLVGDSGLPASIAVAEGLSPSLGAKLKSARGRSEVRDWPRNPPAGWEGRTDTPDLYWWIQPAPHGGTSQQWYHLLGHVCLGGDHIRWQAATHPESRSDWDREPVFLGTWLINNRPVMIFPESTFTQAADLLDWQSFQPNQEDVLAPGEAVRGRKWLKQELERVQEVLSKEGLLEQPPDFYMYMEEKMHPIWVDEQFYEDELVRFFSIHFNGRTDKGGTEILVEPTVEANVEGDPARSKSWHAVPFKWKSWGSRRDFVIDFARALDHSTNEVWLFHGLRHPVHETIKDSEVLHHLASLHHGSTWGPGIYLTDNSGRADEKTEPNPEGIRCMVLCRTVLGRILNQGEGDRNSRRLCTTGGFNSVKGLGVATDYVVYEESQVYPEYLIWYVRAAV